MVHCAFFLLVLYGMVLYGWYGMVLYVKVCYCMVWYHMVRHGMVSSSFSTTNVLPSCPEQKAVWWDKLRELIGDTQTLQYTLHYT